MPKCSCGAETSRIRQIWDKGKVIREECKSCAPESFEKMADPSTKKIWTGPEFAPNDYELVGDTYQLKPEAIHDLEQKACGVQSVAYQEEQQALAEAEAKKRATRRTKPLNQHEIERALAFVDRTLRPMIEDKETVYEV